MGKTFENEGQVSYHVDDDIILSDKSLVSARSFFYLLEWNSQYGNDYIKNNFFKEQVKDLTKEEYKDFFTYATQQESIYDLE